MALRLGTGRERILGIMVFHFCVGGDIVFECFSFGFLGVFLGPRGLIFLPFCDLSLLCVLQIDVFVPSFCEFINTLKLWELAFWSLRQGVCGVMGGLGLVF